jgi:uncharacterized membrane protein
MFNKILVIWWIALAAILIIENMVIPNTAYFFIDNSSSSWFVAFASTIIWIAIWYWIAWLLRKDGIEDDDRLDF